MLVLGFGKLLRKFGVLKADFVLLLLELLNLFLQNKFFVLCLVGLFLCLKHPVLECLDLLLHLLPDDVLLLADLRLKV